MAIKKALFFFLFLTVGLSLPMGSEEPISEGAVPLDIGVDSQVEPAASVVETTASSPQNTEAHLTGKPTETEINADTNEETVTDPTIPNEAEVETTATEVEPTQPENSREPTEIEINADTDEETVTDPSIPTGAEVETTATEVEPNQPENAREPTEAEINADANEETVTNPTIPTGVEVETTATEVELTQPENSIKSTPTESQVDSVGLDDTSAAAPSGPEPNAPAAETEPSQIPDSQPESPKTTARETDEDVAAEPNIAEINSDVNEVEPGSTPSPVTPPESLVPATNLNDQVNVAGPAGGVDEVELSAGEHTPVVQLGVTEVPGDVAASEVDEANAEQETLNRPEESPAGSEDKQEIQPHFEEENQPLLVANEELEESQEKPRVEAAESLAISQFELRTSLLAAMLGVSHLLLHAF
ncbi:hypothetical protein AAHC03_024592 [Spirometra sp. Aus1]